VHHLALQRRVSTRLGIALAAAATTVAAALVSGCGPGVESNDGGFLPDAGHTTPPAAPRLTAPDTPVPWPVSTLRGRAEMARRVLVMGGENPIVSAVLPDSTFCVDVPMRSPGLYSFQLYSQNAGGQLSEMAAMAEVMFDPAAPPIPGAETCTGTDPAGCGGATEICDNDRDDDCDSLVDDRDPECADCMDDALEDNDTVGAPRIDPERIENLMICPADDDYYALFLREEETLSARAFFTHADGDIDMELLAPDGTTTLVRSTTMDDDEMVEHVATERGEHVLHVYGASGIQNGYTLDVTITPGSGM